MISLNKRVKKDEVIYMLGPSQSSDLIQLEHICDQMCLIPPVDFQRLQKNLCQCLWWNNNKDILCWFFH